MILKYFSASVYPAVKIILTGLPVVIQYKTSIAYSLLIINVICNILLQVHANDSDSSAFRRDCEQVLSDSTSQRGIVVNYHMDTLGQGLPFGHFSPLAAYHRATDRLLILDTWQATEVCWATVENLFNAINTLDVKTNLYRGYLLVDKA